MWDIIKIIIEVVLAFILGITVSGLVIIAWMIILASPIIIPILIILAIVGSMIGYVIVRHK